MLEEVLSFVKNFGNSGYLINTFGILLQYVILFFLYLFLFKLSRNIFVDLKIVKRSTRRDGERFFLKIVDAKDAVGLNVGEKVRVDTSLNIGRAENNDIVIALPVVSAEHAIINWKSGGYFLSDLGSTNGTFLNGTRVQGTVAVNLGDEITVGTVKLVAVGE